MCCKRAGAAAAAAAAVFCCRRSPYDLTCDSQLWLIGAFSTLEEALQQVVVEDADLAAAVAAIQDPTERRVAKWLLQSRLAALEAG
jgi:hypothetical protein